MKTVLPALYLKGTFNGWGLDTPLRQISKSIFTTNVTFSADRHQFKIADRNGTDEWTLSAHETDAVELALDCPQTLIPTQGIGNDLAFTPKSSGRYSLVLDFSNEKPLLTLAKASTQSSANQERHLGRFALSSPYSPLFELQSAPNALPPEELFEELAIESNDPFSFVFGDNVDGYFEGETHSFINGGRYRHHQGWYLGVVGSFVNGELNDRSQALAAKLLPIGIEHQYPRSKDTMTIIQGQRGACFTVSSQSSATLSIVPELNINLNSVTLEQHGDILLLKVDEEICPSGCPKYVAISANQPIDAKEVTSADVPEIDSVMQLAGDNIKLFITSNEPTKELTVYFAFEHDQSTAIANAQAATANNAFMVNQQNTYDFLTNNYLWSDDLEYNRAVMWARLSSRNFVSHEFGTGIWAGLPWFKDCWGRDTFIAMSGTSLVNGLFDEAKDIITNFASMQLLDEESINFGRVPNRVTSKTNIIYNTTDGTPWMIREILEYINYSGDLEFAKEIYPVVKRFVKGVEKNYLDQDGLMSHRDPDTWMDAKIEGKVPWSPRGPKANDIQALWFESLQVAIELANFNNDSQQVQEWQALADKVKVSFENKFWDAERKILADRLELEDIPDYSIRPNQLMVLTIPQKEALIKSSYGEFMVKQCVENLLFPWGICSLDQHHIDFHPYHDGRSEYHKDAAYHNGTIWGWNAGFTISALTQFNQHDFSYLLSKNLAKQILSQGHRGSMSENLNAYQESDENLTETGTFAQAWSVSEYARNAQQDYLGFKPELTNNRVCIKPRLPKSWQECAANLPFARDNAIAITVVRNDSGEEYRFTPKVKSSKITLEIGLVDAQLTTECEIHASCDQEMIVRFDTGNQTWSLVSGEATLSQQQITHSKTLESLEFCQPDWSLEHLSLAKTHYLLNKRETEKLDIAQD